MSRRRRRKPGLQNVTSQVLEDRALLSAGSLDGSFANGGILESSTPSNRAVDVELQDDGKIVFGTRGSQVVRLLDDGSPDSSFGTDGVVSLTGPVSDLELLDDGRILVIAGDDNSNGNELYRLNVDGSIDTTFGTNGSFDIAGQTTTANAVTVDDQGRVLFYVSLPNTFVQGNNFGVLGRLTPDGTLDLSFGFNGVANQIGTTGTLADIEVDSDGNILVADGTLARFDTNGNPDSTFSGDGVAGEGNRLVDVAVSDSGTVYASGVDIDSGVGVLFAYDSAGTEVASATHASYMLLDVAIQSDGGVVAAGGTFHSIDEPAFIVRYDEDLNIDTAYGSPQVGPNTSLVDVEADATDRIVGVGSTADGEYLVTRFTAPNKAPVAIDDTASITEDANPNTVTGDVVANDTDVNGDTLVVAEVDGVAANVGSTLSLNYGTVVIHSDGTYTYTLDNSHDAVQALNTGEALVETAVSYTVDDGNGELSTASLTITIAGADEAAGPVQLVDGELIITGTDGDDTVAVTATNGVITVTYSGLPPQTFNESDVDSINVSLGDGDDSIRVDFTDVPANISGGAGDDFLDGSRGDDVFDGGPGNDTLEGFSGNDTLIGGEGDDLILGSTGDDLLLGGSGNDTLFGQSGADVIQGGDGNDGISGGSGGDLLVGGNGGDAINAGSGGDILFGGRVTLSDPDLRLILDEWTSGRTYATRINNIRTGSGPILNGVQIINGVNVLNDNARDLLFGNTGRDWYFASGGDVLFGRSIFEELDII